ncbi:MAG TPA: tol-pal system-associated acyl-CoA thioesterase [Crenotrichaceae bacterium]|nr:tol-pal system-associated acyl-CoA thioesterase [Crenotrichaceae bacterium]
MTNFQWPVRVYYEDTDAGGVVYYANYLRFFERARTEWMRASGFEQDQLRQQHQLVFAVRSIEVDYLFPARFNQLLLVDTHITQFRGASILFSQQISSTEPDTIQVLCRAHVRIVCINAQSFTPCPIPDFLKSELQKNV